MDANIGTKTILTLKLIILFYWLFGLQMIDYKFGEFTLAGLQRRVYPTVIILFVSTAGILNVYFLRYSFNEIVMQSINLVELLLVTFVSTLTILFDSFWHSKKKLRFYNNLNECYNNLFESEYLKSKAITNVLIIYIFYLLYFIATTVELFWCFGFSLGLLQNAMRGPILDLTVLQILVEIYLCLLGFISLNKNLIDLNFEIYGDKYLNDLTDFKRISICPNLYGCEWFKSTKKKKQARNLQTSIDVYVMLMENIELISAQFGILFLILSFNALVTCIGTVNVVLTQDPFIMLATIPTVITEIIWLHNCIAPVVLGVLTSEALNLESTRSRSILAKSLICTTTDPEMNRDLLKLANLLKKKNLGISVYGIPIDSTFIFSLVALTASYSIIVMQTNI